MSDLTTTQIFAAGEKNITATKMNNIIGGAVIQPDFYAGKPTASSVAPTDQMLILKSGAYAQTPFQTIIDSVGSSMGPQITAVRLRSFNALQNSVFEVDQRNVGNAVTANGFIQDRWSLFKSGTLAVSCNQVTLGGAGYLTVPGTNFPITTKVLRITLTTAQASLGATDQITISQAVEGIRLRELVGDVHSFSILARSSVANLKFGLAIRDNNNTHSLVNLCTLGAANTLTLITLPNLPVFVAGGSWGITPGVVGYNLSISLAGGSTITTPANGAWQNGNFTAASGQDSFAAQAVNSTFDIAFVQHEPGAVCTTPIDCPFGQNLDECLRYYYKTYDYAVAVGSNNANGLASGIGASGTPGAATTLVVNNAAYLKELAKTPTIHCWSAAGAANVVNWSSGTITTSGAGQIGLKKFGILNIVSTSVGGCSIQYHFDADTGW